MLLYTYHAWPRTAVFITSPFLDDAGGSRPWDPVARPAAPMAMPATIDAYAHASCRHKFTHWFLVNLLIDETSISRMVASVPTTLGIHLRTRIVSKPYCRSDRHARTCALSFTRSFTGLDTLHTTQQYTVEVRLRNYSLDLLSTCRTGGGGSKGTAHGHFMGTVAHTCCEKKDRPRNTLSMPCAARFICAACRLHRLWERAG